MKKLLATLLALTMLLSILPMGVSAYFNDGQMDWSTPDDFTYTIVGGEVTITGYNGAGGEVIIPATIEDCPVVAIGSGAFANQTTITALGLPATVTAIDYGAFAGCSELLDVYFDGTNTQRWDINVGNNNAPLYNVTWFYQASLDELFDSALGMFDFFYPNDLLGYVDEFMCGKYYDYALADSTDDFGFQLIPAAKYEAGLERYFALTDAQLDTHRTEMMYDWQTDSYLPRYNEATDSYYVQYMGGRGGMLADRQYLGYEQTGDGFYTVFYQHLNYEFLSDAGNKKAEQAGWPETFTYNGKVYENGPDGYYRVESRDDYGIMYKLEYHGKQVRILSQEDYTAADLPDEFKKATIVTQPKSEQVKNGETAVVTVGAVGPGLTYQWYFKNKGDNSFAKSSIKTNTYTVKMSSTSRDRSVYCVIKDNKGNSVKSNTVVLRMAATITKESAVPSLAKLNANASVTVTAIGDGLTYQWYVKNPGATEYVKSSVTKATYSAKMTEQNNGRLVYCVVKDKYGKEDTSKTFELRLQASIISQPKTVTATKNTTARVQINAAGDGLTYTWYFKNSGAKSFSKSSVTTNTYSVKMTSASNGRQVYCVVKDKYGKSVKSGTVTLKYETNYVYKVSDGKATITGYKGKGGAISIPAALGGYPVTAIGDSAFFDCGNLTTVTIPAGVTAIDPGAFLRSNVSKFVVSVSNPYFSANDGVLFNKEQTELLLIPESKTGSYTVPDGVVRITGSAGSYSSISTLIIPDSVQVIEGGAFGMSSLLKKVIIGNGVTTIGDQAFVYCGELTSLTLGRNVSTIGYAAFHETGLTTLALPKSVVSIGDSNFPYNSFSDIYYEGSSSEFENISIGEGNDSLLSAPRQYNCRFVSLVSQPEDAYAAVDAKATAMVEADGDGLTYTWYIKNKGAKSYATSSVKTATYSTVMSSSSRDRSVYCVVKDAYGNEVRSNTVVLHMTASITKQPATVVYAKNNATAKVVFTAAGDGLTYQWYVKNPGATEYVKSSVKDAAYAVKMTAANSGRLVYCVVTDAYGNAVKTNIVTLRRQATIVTQPKTVKVKNGATAKTTVKAAGDGLTYTWYIKNKGAKSFSKSSIKTATYSVKMTTKVNGRQVYCVVKDKYGKTVKSSTVTMKKK